MATHQHQLAQVNIARLLAPLDSPRLAGFVAALEPINAVADRSPGFVWRLQTEAGDATALRVFDDDHMLVNMSTWDSLDALADFVYRSAHIAVMRQRRSWFEHMQIYVALWWAPAGYRPTVADAEARLQHLEANGPTPFAFTFQSPFPPAGVDAAIEARFDDLCPV
jgi:Domain of unknown function (DUF3291)